MKFVASFAADMMDLIIERERHTQFGDYFLSAIRNQCPTVKRFLALVWRDLGMPLISANRLEPS